jgi:hypothetical protein
VKPMPGTPDYDKPRRPMLDVDENSLEELKTRRVSAQSRAVDIDEAEPPESFELPGADLSDEELTVAVVPMLPDEFRCASCFLVHHRSQRADQSHGQNLCRECF